MTDEWLRSPVWDEKARGEFEQRLSRSRVSNRAQYLRVKAVSLLQCSDERRSAGQELLQRLVADYPDAPDVATAHELLGESYAEVGKLELAESHFRASLAAAGPTRSYTSGAPDLSLAEVLIESGRPAALKEAGQLLDSEGLHQNLSWNSQVFRYLKARAELADRLGVEDEAHEYAERALEAARGDQPQLDRHPDVGRVVVDMKVLKRLRELARR